MENKKSFVRKLLKIEQPMEVSPTRLSSIALLLKGARKMSGRNVESGIYEKNEYKEENFLDHIYFSFQFTSLINYLIFLEQIGSIFKPSNQKEVTGSGKKNGIFRSLSYYTKLGDDEKRSIVALRNSLTHKFGLATESNPRSGFPVRFSLSIERNKRIVKVPLDRNKWKGEFTNKLDQNLTTIYIIDLIDLIEDVYKSIMIDLKEGNIDILKSVEELKARYTIVNE